MYIRFQKLQAFIINNISEEQLKKYQKETNDSVNKQNYSPTFSEEWMEHATTLSLFFAYIQDEAEKQNLVEEVNFEDEFSKITSLVKQDLNSPDDQAHTQPE